MAEIWNQNERVAERNWNVPPEVGDVLELDVDGEVGTYEVEKIFRYYPREGKPVDRIAVKYAGGEPSIVVF